MATRRGLMAAAGLAASGLAASGLAVGPAFAEATTLRVGSTATGVPFTFLDTKTNTIQGIMVDLVRAIGADAGFEVSIEPMQFSTLIPALTSGKIDIIAAAMFATPARAQIIDFTDAVITYGEGLVVPAADKTDYAAMADLKGKVVGAQVGTAFVEPLQKSGLFPEVKIYDTIPDILRDVNAGRLGAGFADYPIVAYNLQLGGFPGTRLVRSYKASLPGSVGIGVRKGDPLRGRLDASLATLKANGTVTRVLAKWGLE